MGEWKSGQWRLVGIVVIGLFGLLLSSPQAGATSYVPGPAFGDSGSEAGQISSPYGVTLDPQGNLYVVDAGNSQVQVFNPAGTTTLEFGRPGSGDGEFAGPSGITLDSDGLIWVTDTGNDRIQAFTSSGEFLGEITEGAGGEDLDQPVGITTAPDGRILVTEIGNKRVQIYDVVAETISSFGAGGSGNGQFNVPSGVAVDATGRIHVVDALAHRIQTFTGGGIFISSLGSLGSGAGQFNNPVAIDFASSGKSFVTDSGNRRVQEFSPAGVPGVALVLPGDTGDPAASPFDVEVGPLDSLYVSYPVADVVRRWTLRHDLRIARAGSGDGSFSTANMTKGSAPSSPECSSGVCSASFENGDTVRVTAVPSAGSRFTGWSGACSGTAPCDVSMDGDAELTATFTREHRLSITRNGTGSGTVFSSPAGINCGSACSATLPEGSVVSLGATPAPGSVFTGWSGVDCPGTGGCDVGLAAERNITATFDLIAPVVRRAPKAKITGKPGKKTKARKATFKFRADLAGATFLCRIDRKKFTGCRSPRTFRGLKPGNHTFQVKAKASGLTGAVAAYTWKIKKK